MIKIGWLNFTGENIQYEELFVIAVAVVNHDNCQSAILS